MQVYHSGCIQPRDTSPVCLEWIQKTRQASLARQTSCSLHLHHIQSETELPQSGAEMPNQWIHRRLSPPRPLAVRTRLENSQQKS